MTKVILFMQDNLKPLDDAKSFLVLSEQLLRYFSKDRWRDLMIGFSYKI